MSQEKECIAVAPKIGDPGPSLNFVFTMLTMCFWGIYAGIYTGPVLLAIGLVQLMCFPPYVIGAILYYLRGEAMAGAIFMIFGTLFGGIGGILNVAIGLSYDITTQMAAIPFIWGALSLIPLIVAGWKTNSAAGTLTFICVVAFLLLMSFVSFNVLPESTNGLIKWLLLFVAVVGYYTGLNSLLEMGGVKKLPEGKPIGLWFSK